MGSFSIVFSKLFARHYEKRILPNKALVRRFEERVNIFRIDRRSPMLRDHSLRGTLVNHRSFSITGDIRVIYIQQEDKIIFLDIGTHNQVY